MAGVHEIIRNFATFGGLDKRSSELIKDRIFATKYFNAQQKQSTAIEKRLGTKALIKTAGTLGGFDYARINTTTGQITLEPVQLGQAGLYRRTSNTFTIAYSGAATTVLFTMAVDSTSGTFKATIVADSVTLLNYDLGTGIQETTPITLANLQTQINALSGFTATISGSTGLPAALLPITVEGQITNSTSLVLTYFDWSLINTPVSNPMTATYNARGQDDFENPSSVNLNGCLYISSGYDNLMKYDGQTFYRAGLPQATLPSNVTLAGTGWTDTSIQYFAVYFQKDAQGNFIYGQTSAASNTISPANQTATITVSNLQSSTGFNTNCATVNGAQTGVTTITVNNTPHTLQVGDTAYFFDGASNTYVERPITARTATSITISGAAVNVSNGDVISNNLRIKLLRTTASGTVKYEVVRGPNNAPVEIPNNSFTATQTFADGTGARGSSFVEQPITPSLPAKCRYIQAHQNLLVMAGDPLNANTVYYGDIDFPEGFDVLRHSFDCVSSNGDVIRGLGVNNEILAVFKTNFAIGSVFVVSGLLQLGQYRVDTLSKNLGAVSHSSIKEIEGLIYFLSERGVYRMASGQLPEEVSLNIRPVFTDYIPNNSRYWVYKRAVAGVDTKNQKYLLFLGDESLFGSQWVSGSESRVWAFDYFRNSWAEWNNINASAGIVLIGDDVWFFERRSDSISSACESFAYKFMGNDKAQHYNDHAQPITWSFGSVWEAFQDPSNFKLFLRTKLLSLEPSVSTTFTIDYQSELNYVENVGLTNASFYVGNALYGYGLSAWGSDPWGDPSSPLTPIVKNRTTKAKSMRFVISNSKYSENVVISGYQLEVAVPYRTGILKD